MAAPHHRPHGEAVHALRHAEYSHRGRVDPLTAIAPSAARATDPLITIKAGLRRQVKMAYAQRFQHGFTVHTTRVSAHRRKPCWVVLLAAAMTLA